MRVFKNIFFYFFVFMLSASILSCRTETVESTINKEILLPNNKYLSVLKTNKDKTSIGMYTNTNYGTTHSYSYSLHINNKEINWIGNSDEPKHILFCNNETYLHLLSNRRIETEKYDVESDSTIISYSYKVQDVYKKHVDKRYFFNFLGNEYWHEIKEEEYNYAKRNCTEYSVPNDNELKVEN